MSLEPLCCTLWDLADAVRLESEKVFREEDSIQKATDLVLARLLWRYGKNVEVVDDRDVLDFRGAHAEF